MTRKAKRDIRRVLLAVISILIAGLVASFEMDLLGTAYYVLLALCIMALVVVIIMVETSKS